MNHRAVAVVFALAASTIGLPARAAPPDEPAVRVNTPRGVPIEVIEQRPAGKGRFPVVILGSGAGYHMRLPVLERVARALVAAGIGVYRFDWAYRVRDPEKGKFSPDRVPEVEDLNTVLQLARKAAWVDPTRIAIGGKSLGSIIAWRVLQKAPDVKGALLLTPVCTPGTPPAPKSPEDNYPHVADETRPTAWLLGNADPVCTPAILYRHLADTKRAQIDVLRGDHSFRSSSAKPPVEDDATLDLVARLSVDFATTLLAPPSAPAK